MNFLEKDLEEIIFTSSKDLLRERGLFIPNRSKFKRQLRVGNYGIVDLVSITRPLFIPSEKRMWKGEICVYELKKDKISISSFLQALNYLKGIQRYLDKKGSLENYDYKIRLIGKDCDKHSSFIYLSDIINTDEYDEGLDRPSRFYVEKYVYTYGIEGILFKDVCGYSLTNEGF